MEREAGEDPPQKHAREQRHEWTEIVVQGLEVTGFMKEFIRAPAVSFHGTFPGTNTDFVVESHEEVSTSLSLVHFHSFFNTHRK